jgi:O-antigen/teichoic acid export membrane protein
MNPADFGETQTIILIFTQTVVFIQVLSLISIGIIAKYPSENIRTTITNELSRLSLACSVILFLAILIFSESLKTFFHFSAVSPFIALALALLLSVPLAFANLYLQGHNRFMTLSMSNIIGSSTKILLAAIFVVAGLRTLGAISGLVCAQLLALIYVLKVSKDIRHFVVTHLHVKKLQSTVIKPVLPFASIVFITCLITNLLLSFDILAVKHYFPPIEAGYYAGISIIANIIFLVTGLFASVLIQSIKPDQGIKYNTKLLIRSLLLLIAVGGAVTLVFMLAPHLIVTILLGHRFAMYAINLRGLSLALFFMSIANLLVYYHIGMRNYLVAPVVTVGLLVLLVLLQHYHGSIAIVVRDLVQASCTVLGLLIVLTVVIQYRTRHVSSQLHLYILSLLYSNRY